MKNPFDVLGINTTATPKQIEKAYNREVKNAQRDITNEGALETKLSELSWAFTELLNDDSRNKYETIESQEIKIKQRENHTSIINIVLKYIPCVVLAIFIGSHSILATAISLALIWIEDFIITKLFTSTEESYTAHNIIRWIIVALNSIVLIGSLTSFFNFNNMEGFETIGLLMPYVLMYAVVIVATFVFGKIAEKRMDK